MTQKTAFGKTELGKLEVGERAYITRFVGQRQVEFVGTVSEVRDKAIKLTGRGNWFIWLPRSAIKSYPTTEVLEGHDDEGNIKTVDFTVYRHQLAQWFKPNQYQCRYMSEFQVR